jgi:hypothetical protein
VRFRADVDAAGEVSLCHCRMCQKATGGLFGPYASLPTAALVWTRGERRLFLSSEHIARGFCADCGTPLTFEAASGQGRHIGLTIGAFDDPADLPAQLQIGVAYRIPWVASLANVPDRPPEEDAARATKYPPVVSRQHPDHDTETWPPKR